MSPLVIFALASLAIASAAPAEPTTPVAILRHAVDGPHPDGAYNFAYETADGTKFEETGSVKAVAAARSVDGEEGPTSAIAAQGAFAFTAPDGQSYSVSYVADENGFQPQGAHLPVAPAIPEAIARALEYIAAHPQKEEEQH